jgi:hypothetical protein
VKTFSQIRQNTDLRIFLLEAFGVCYSFTAAAFRSDHPSILEDPWALVRLAIPAISVLLALLLRNACSGSDERPHYASAVDVALALALAVLSQVVLSKIAPAWMLPRWAPTQGGLAGWMFLSVLRALFPPHPKVLRELEIKMSLEEIRWKTEELQRESRRWNLRGYLVSAAVIVIFGSLSVQAQSARVRMGAGLIIVSAVCILYQIKQKREPRQIPNGFGFAEYREVYSNELRRHALLLRDVRYWCLGLFLPGAVLMLLGSRVYEFFIVMYILLMAEFLYRAMQGLRREADELNAPPVLWSSANP